MAALLSLKAAGGHYTITNQPKRRFHPPMVGRSHIKGAVVGKRVFVGGCNLEHAEQLDVMVTWKSALAAEKLSNWLLQIAETGSVRQALADVDAEVALDSTTRLLIDAGVPNQSLIYDEALQLIDSAQQWIYITCQYFPGGPTARHLAAAQARGVHVEIDYSHPRTQGNAAPLHYAHQVAQRARKLPRNFFAGKLDKQVPKLHAKVLASEQMAMIGSHNYVIQGVHFGTAELALTSLDPEFSMHLRDFIREQLAAFDLPAQHAVRQKHIGTK
jgi:phosphatidylserine/phosphatidylglycerophosphate/cardiolipin synthase-like enzyme